MSSDPLTIACGRGALEILAVGEAGQAPPRDWPIGYRLGSGTQIPLVQPEGAELRHSGQRHR